MSDLISRRAVYHVLDCVKFINDDERKYACSLMEQIEGQPKHGQTTHSEQPKKDKFVVKTSETCEDCISRQAAIDACIRVQEHHAYDEIEEIKALPPAKPERKTGQWIMKYKGSAVTSYKCSECGRTVKDDTGYDVSKDYPFCHCGADMRQRGEQDGKR